MGISEKLKEDAKFIWDKIINHPFIEELCSGNLKIDKFKFYILQDYHYLTLAIKNFCIITSKAESIEDLIEVVKIGYEVSTTEYTNYLNLLGRIGLSIKDAEKTKPASIVLSYIDFLFNVSRRKSFSESLVSILPCFWSYGEAIKNNKDKLSTNKEEIYIKWIEVYFSEKYNQLLKRIQNLIEKSSVNFSYNKLKKIFIKASMYEYLYWDAMYSFKN